MKKFLILIIGVLITSLAISFGYSTWKQLTLINKVKNLPVITVNGENYKTTGVIPTEDAGSQKTFSEIVDIASRAPISTPNFNISVETNSSIIIKLFAPYDQSKIAAEKWFEDNGYDLSLLSNKISYIDSNQ